MGALSQAEGGRGVEGRGGQGERWELAWLDAKTGCRRMSPSVSLLVATPLMQNSSRERSDCSTPHLSPAIVCVRGVAPALGTPPMPPVWCPQWSRSPVPTQDCSHQAARLHMGNLGEQSVEIDTHLVPHSPEGVHSHPVAPWLAVLCQGAPTQHVEPALDGPALEWCSWPLVHKPQRRERCAPCYEELGLH